MNRCMGKGKENEHLRGQTMRYTEARPGRVFILRLEYGDIVHETIERFAVEHNIVAAR